MSFQIIIHREAAVDFSTIYHYIEAQTPGGAIAWADAFRDARDRVLKNPYACGLIPERARMLVDYREYFFKTKRGRRYRVIFAIEAQTITILYIRGPGQDYIYTKELRLP